MTDEIEFLSNVNGIISTIQSCKSAACIQDELEQYICRFNIKHYIVTCLPLSDVAAKSFILANKWPEDWWHHYLENNFAQDDPVVQECMRSDTPLEWDENTPDYQEPGVNLERAHKIRQDADAFGLRRGFVIPIHRAHGFCGAVSYIGKHLEIPQEDKPLLHLVSIYAFEHLFKLSGLEHSKITFLTEREKEVTQWAARGMTSDQISDLVGITPRTVIMHLQNAAKKLGASNRTHLVARALQLAQIDI